MKGTNDRIKKTTEFDPFSQVAKKEMGEAAGKHFGVSKDLIRSIYFCDLEPDSQKGSQAAAGMANGLCLSAASKDSKVN
jgi:hypothetical protein